ncbi:MAG: PAN domain-containing protein [Methanotrichaceae archaeon]|nr:PAN domain-containing protein [Methanotrichaceae archaeon]
MYKKIIALTSFICLCGISIAILPDTDLPGSDLDNFNLTEANPSRCEQMCLQTSECEAWTYVKPGVQGPNPHCWLKSSVPEAVSNDCCTSGLRTEYTEPEPGTNDQLRKAPTYTGGELPPQEPQWTSGGEESPTNAEVINSRVFMDDLKSHSDDYVIFAYNLPSPPKYIITESGDQLAVEVECCQQHPSVAYAGLQLQNISSLNLQMTMDRRSKFVQTLSNIMKKINYTQEASIMGHIYR